MIKTLFPYRSVFFTAALFAVALLLAQCMNNEEKNTDVAIGKFEQFAGSEACASCHAAIYKSHLQTAHYRSAWPASDSNILGSFAAGQNEFHFNDHLKVAMERRANQAYQVAYQGGKEKIARRMDIVVGSGAMGQSFLSWRGQGLYQLPITYFSAAQTWSNSPGFPHKVVFNRVITSRCLECHVTFAQTLTPPGTEPEKFDKQKLIFGVDCEKCHGPAAQHVAFQKKNPKDTTGKYVLNPAQFTRQQNLDLCASCHGGALQKKTASFSFMPGNDLSDHFIVNTTTPSPAQIDVHGNQYGLLRSSACFKNSTTLTCNSCHNTHQPERGNLKLLSQRCMSCHSQEHQSFCTKKLPAVKLIANCIDCHMPLQPSRAIAVFLPGKSAPTAALIRSHHIAVYASAAEGKLPGLSTAK